MQFQIASGSFLIDLDTLAPFLSLGLGYGPTWGSASDIQPIIGEVFVIPAVPEPASLFLLGIGALGLTLRLRRRTRQS